MQREVVPVLLIASLLVYSSAFLVAAQPDKPDPDRVSMDRLRDDYVSAFNAGDANRVSNIYASDAIIMPANEPIVNGRAAIREWFRKAFEQYSMKVSLSSAELVILGKEWAFDRGTYKMTITPKTGGAPAEEEYKYLTLLHKESDGWKAKRDIYNNSKALQ